MEGKRNTIGLINKTHLSCIASFFFFFFFFIIIFSICTLFSTASGSTNTCLDSSRCPMFADADIDFQESHSQHARIGEGTVSEGKTEVPLGWARRFLGGPGSSPPRCTMKCGNCTPCRPVHVPVPPGTPVTAEYYPEAWRCKCGNKLYMP